MANDSRNTPDDDDYIFDDEDDEVVSIQVPSESFLPVDLLPAWRGEKQWPTGEVFRVDDVGPALLLPGINYLHGDSGDGKSMVATLATFSELSLGRRVIWVTYEDAHEQLIVERLRMLGATEAMMERLDFIVPDASLRDGAEYIGNLARVGEARLLVLDSVGGAMAVDGTDEDRDAQVYPWFKSTLETIAKLAPALAILPIDHGTKANGKDGKLYPSGSKRKRAIVSGRAYLLEVNGQPFKAGAVGFVRLVVAKDRTGTWGRNEIAAVIRLDSTGSVATYTVSSGADGHDRAEAESVQIVAERVSNFLAAKPDEWFSQTQIEKAVTGNNGQIRQAARWLAESDDAYAELRVVSKKDGKQWRSYRHLRLYEEPEGADD